MYNIGVSERQAFTRKSADTRRNSLVAACARCMARYGAQGTTVRAVCLEACVSPGLLRHYFDGIHALIAETCRATGQRVANARNAAVDGVPADQPRARLTMFVSVNFRLPIADPQLLATWLAFCSLARHDAVLKSLHDEIYTEDLRLLEALIVACPGAPAQSRMAAIAMTALIEGLWLDLALGKAPIRPDEADNLATHLIASFLTITS